MKRILIEPIAIQTKDGTVFGYYLPDGKVKINKGSFFRIHEVNSIRNNVKNLRTYLVDYGYVSNGKLIKDYIFDNPSLAIDVMMGHMESGNKSFFTNDNIDLGTFLEIDKIEYYKSLKRQNIELDDEEGFYSTLDIDDDEITKSLNPAPVPELIEGKLNVYKRNPIKAKNAIIKYGYKCMIDENHKTFITKQNKPYMEAHHLIPLSCQKDFNVSLDVEANIVSLCSNCHRMIHYGKDIENLLKRLYESRKEALQECGIYISFEKLLEYYK